MALLNDFPDFNSIIDETTTTVSPWTAIMVIIGIMMICYVVFSFANGS